MTDPMERPVPVADDTSAPFWAAAAEGVLVLARCAACGAATHPPEVVCPNCRSTEPGWRWEVAATTGVVRSWTVLRQPFLPGFAPDLPIVLVDVAIDGTDDVRLVGRLLEPSGETGDHVTVPGAASPVTGTSSAASGSPSSPATGEAGSGRAAQSPAPGLRIGQAVVVDFERFGDGVAVPAFRLAAQ